METGENGEWGRIKEKSNEEQSGEDKQQKIEETRGPRKTLNPSIMTNLWGIIEDMCFRDCSVVRLFLGKQVPGK